MGWWEDAIANQQREWDRAVAEIGKPITATREPTVKRAGSRCPELNESWLGKVKAGMTALKVLSSPLVSTDVYANRMGACHACPHCTESLDGKHFCECCGCPEWSAFGEGSDLESKNKHEGHMCPALPPRF